MKAYPDNTISAFAVKLAQEIDLGTECYEMAHCEFWCPPPKFGTQKPHAVFLRYERLNLLRLHSPSVCKSLQGSLFKDIYSPTAFCNEVVQLTAFCNEVFGNLYSYR